jgi:1-acyl-sn-glycerol-3-phosphate acyltransferase
VSLHYDAIRRFLYGAFGLMSGWELRGREHVPRMGSLIVASNHQSYWDPPLVGAATPRGDLHYLAKAELFKPPLFGPLIRSVNAIPIRRGMADLTGMSRAIDVLRSGGALIVFPEGTRSTDGELQPARPGVGMLAVHGDSVIVPCSVIGSNRPRRWMLHSGRLTIWFGRPRHWKDYVEPEADLTPGRALYQKVGDAVMREVAVLRTGQRTAASRGAA